MFMPLVVVCSLVTGQCVALEDKEGPYRTVDQCQASLSAAVPEFETSEPDNPHIPAPRRVTGFCIKQGEEV